MSAIPTSDRLLDLLADRALVGLDAGETVELQRLLSAHAGMHEDAFDLAAAALHLGLGVEEEALPESIRTRLERTADDFVRPAPTSGHDDPRTEIVRQEVVERPRIAGRIQWTPWLVAAAAALFAAIAWMRPAVPTTPKAPIAAQFAALREAPGTITLEWTALDDPTAESAGGEVIWNESEQRGFMRFRGLAANDPTQQQYQLWIFDATRPEATPVDGGVFDIPATDEVIVPIHAKLPVRDAAAFAVTVEPPGGVVVSDRSRLALLASKG